MQLVCVHSIVFFIRDSSTLRYKNLNKVFVPDFCVGQKVSKMIGYETPYKLELLYIAVKCRTQDFANDMQRL